MPVEDNFRVEMQENTGRWMVLARAATLPIILAAWHEAVRTTPGATLALRNGRFTMEQMRTPGNGPAKPRTSIKHNEESFDTALCDLRSWHRLRIICLGCARNAYVDPADMMRRHGKTAILSQLERRMRCQKCGIGPVRIEVRNLPR